MTRHGKNCTAGTVYTYHERSKDSKSSGYGTKDVRLGKDSIKEFDCCCLSLQPCRNPVVTQDGFLYDKQAILEYIVHKKKEIARKQKEFEKQKHKHSKEDKEIQALAQETLLKNFMAKQGVGSKVEAASTSGSISNMAEGKNKQLPAFWLPTLTPEAKGTVLKKPDEKVCCPMSGKAIKLKDLIDVRFTLIKDGDKRSLITKDARYVCPVTNDVLGNSVPCVVLRTSGHVVTQECVDKILSKDMVDPMNGKPLTAKDIIPLQRGATGFSGAGVDLKAKKAGPALMTA
ncbi:hypothetical protein CAPTEDRAFT_223572 [Capitella teleta]|uniref:Nitric oxide synthase-interacting protein zinc-finger domain-containing protein n=1 Tax=Capitella teleta TaxID=283909 RepID=R7UYT0_CAPTE|nr:hypothetical protein CAPTEDRAFT_223572 [Capitella teleta]|eukprot:ELU09087.1 hypothetical protein CAPTEDRAFT_223572 [Capitella teleta]